MKKVLLIFLTFLLCVGLTGCSIQNLIGLNKKGSGTTSKNQQKKIIAVSLDDNDPNKTLILRGIEDMAEKEELEIKVLSGEDSESPLKDAKVLIYKGGDKKLLQEARKDNLPILSINELPAGVEIAGIILPDPEEIGQLMAKPIISQLTEGQVVYLQGDPGDSTAQEAVASLKSALNAKPKVTVHSIASPTGSEAASIQALSEYLAVNSEKAKVICTHNEKLASQAISLLEKLKLADKIQVVGGEANIKSLERMTTGNQLADIDTSPYIQGVNALQWAKKVMNKETLDITESVTSDQGEVPAKIIPVKSVTPENLAVIQKTYTRAQEEEQKKQQEQQKEQSSSEGKNSKNTSSDKGSGGSEEGKPQSQSQSSPSGGGSTQGSASLPEGVNMVKESVRTEITREYLDSKGNVIGTEKNANNQARTIPPEMLLQEMKAANQGQQQGQQQGQGGQDKGSSGGDQKEGQGGS